MNLQQLVDELRNNILYDRSDSVSGDPDQLWTDATLVSYINEAQRRFAIRSLCIIDKTTAAACQVTLLTDTAEYELHPSVIGVLSARLNAEEHDLARTGHSLLNRYIPPSEDFWDAAQLAATSGKPLAFSTDEAVLDDSSSWGSATLRVYPKPSATYNNTLLKLRVARKPINTFTTTAMSSQTPEVPVDYHVDMLDWAAYLALRINDVDAGSMRRAEKFAASFEAHVQDARKQVLRKLRAPQPWGFGRGGFRWGS